MQQPEERTGQSTENDLKDSEREQHLDPAAKRAWRISGGLQSLFYWILPIAYANWYQSLNLPFELIYPLGTLVIIYSVLAVTIIPVIRWKRWRYRIGEHEIELRRGLFVITRTLIPVYRVQHVDTSQGPLYSYYKLASVAISTAATTHEIPALSEEVADQARNNISKLARTAREDVSI